MGTNQSIPQNITIDTLKHYPVTHYELVTELKNLKQNGPKLVDWLVKLKKAIIDHSYNPQLDFQRSDYGIVRYDAKEGCFIVEALKYINGVGLMINDDLPLQGNRITKIDHGPMCVLYKNNGYVDIILLD